MKAGIYLILFIITTLIMFMLMYLSNPFDNKVNYRERCIEVGGNGFYWAGQDEKISCVTNASVNSEYISINKEPKKLSYYIYGYGVLSLVIPSLWFLHKFDEKVV